MRLAPERFTLGRLMIAIALLAAVLGAAVYRVENADVERAMATADLRAANGDDPAARRRAALRLADASRGGGRASAAAALARLALGDSDPEARRFAVAGLGRVLVDAEKRLGPPRLVPPPALGDVGDEAALIEVVCRALGDGDAGVRLAAARVLDDLLVQSGWLGGCRLAARLEARAGDPLGRVLADADPATRAAAIAALSRLTAPPAAARDRAVALLRSDPDLNVRVAAIEALARGWPTADRFPVLLDRWDVAPDPREREALVTALAGKAIPPDSAVPGLLRVLAGDPLGPWVVPPFLDGRADARSYLGALGAAAARTLATPEPAWPAVAAVVQIDPGSAEARALLAPLGRFLDGPAPYYVKDEGWRVLSRYGAAAAPLVPTLRSFLRSPNVADQDQAARILGAIGRPALEAIGDLEALARRRPAPAIASTLAWLVQLRDEAEAEPR